MATTTTEGLILKFILESGVAAPLSGSEESWAIIEEVYNKLQPYIEGNTGLLVKLLFFYLFLRIEE